MKPPPKSSTVEYRTWASMWRRVRDTKRARVKRVYFDRGITVDERWRSFNNFLADMGPRPPGTSLDRRDGSKGYSPDNCRWATILEQSRNRRDNRFITAQGKTLCIAEWAELTGITQTAITQRLIAGWSEEEAVSMVKESRLKRKKTPESDRILADGSRSGLRTIHPGGRVFWSGHWFKVVDGPVPREEYEAIPLLQRVQANTPKPKYDGSMDGKRARFYDYGPSDEPRCPHLHSIEGEEWPGPACVAGVFVWTKFEPCEPTR